MGRKACSSRRPDADEKTRGASSDGPTYSLYPRAHLLLFRQSFDVIGDTRSSAHNELSLDSDAVDAIPLPIKRRPRSIVPGHETRSRGTCQGIRTSLEAGIECT